MAEFNPKLFGERLKELRGSETQEKIGNLAGVPDYVLARYERGDTDKPAYQYIINIGNVLGVTPNEMAALAGLYVMEGFEVEQLGGRKRGLRQFENVFMALTEEEQSYIIGILELSIEAAHRKRQPKEPDSALPEWFQRKPIS